MERTAFKAMMFAHRAHKNQRRKYTNSPYTDHLAEVAGIVATVAPYDFIDMMVSVAWLHDCVEDQDVSIQELKDSFGVVIAFGGRSLERYGNRQSSRAKEIKPLKAGGFSQLGADHKVCRHHQQHF